MKPLEPEVVIDIDAYFNSADPGDGPPEMGAPRNGAAAANVDSTTAPPVADEWAVQITAVSPSIQRKMIARAKMARQEVQRQHALSTNANVPQHTHIFERSHVEMIGSRLGVVLASIIGAALTFHFNHELGYNSVLASAAVGVIVHNLNSPYREAAFSGTFGGMSGHIDTPRAPFSGWSVLALGAMIGALFLLLEKRLNGVGGKLGMSAFIAGCASAALGRFFGNDWKPISDTAWDSWTFEIGVQAVVAGTLGTLATVILLHKKKPCQSTTLASATVGLAAVSLLSWQPTTPSRIVPFIYTGSFAGMTADTRLQPISSVLAGFIGSCLLIALWPVGPFVGGKYGLSALIGVLIVEQMPFSQLKFKDVINSVLHRTGSQTRMPDNVPHSEKDVTGSPAPVPFGFNLMSVVAAAQQEGEELDWVDWIPERAWRLTSEFLQRGSTWHAANEAMLAVYNMRLQGYTVAKPPTLRQLLQSACGAEHGETSFRSSRTFGAKKASTKSALGWFQALAGESDSLSYEQGVELLSALDALGTGISEGEELTIVDFENHVKSRATRRRQRDYSMRHMVSKVEGGHYA